MKRASVRYSLNQVNMGRSFAKFATRITKNLYLSQIRTVVTATASKATENFLLMRFITPKDISLSARMKVAGKVFLMNS
jgi:hypothetical protein